MDLVMETKAMPAIPTLPIGLIATVLLPDAKFKVRLSIFWLSQTPVDFISRIPLETPLTKTSTRAFSEALLIIKRNALYLSAFASMFQLMRPSDVAGDCWRR